MKVKVSKEVRDNTLFVAFFFFCLALSVSIWSMIGWAVGHHCEQQQEEQQ